MVCMSSRLMSCATLNELVSESFGWPDKKGFEANYTLLIHNSKEPPDCLASIFGITSGAISISSTLDVLRHTPEQFFVGCLEWSCACDSTRIMSCSTRKALGLRSGGFRR